MPSHIGLAGNDMADGLAKAACMLDVGDMAAEPSLRCQRNTIYSAGYTSGPLYPRNPPRAPPMTPHLLQSSPPKSGIPQRYGTLCTSHDPKCPPLSLHPPQFLFL
ncbi:hypothetical protein Pcinc_008792 [Petrolisthes cinctipes]|uniref:Uncharacterized protein n=1 Tax=Petrolisthes cinctipes TaxID=88211 RepID=A0AAE1G833_PETCI|nr:hypothetical protein Pcinc_009107 [Petrolisthes cinctipes]KAK3887105.1 hypothetical protein Pcinc_008792 [Petrolisthes cinctipes]